MRKKGLTLILVLICVSSLLGTMSAYAQNQTGSLSIDPFIEWEFDPPPIDFPTTFIPETVTEKLYAILDPAQSANRFIIYDNNNAKGFSVTASMSDLTTPDDSMIDYRSVSVVTLTRTGADVDTESAFNNPPGASYITAPAKCVSWASDSGDTLSTLDDKCDSTMDTAFSMFYESPPISSSTLDLPANPGDPTLSVANGGAFDVPPPGTPFYIVRIGTDLIKYENISGNTLTGVSGIDIAHLPGEPVIPHYLQSGALTIMENTDAPDTGFYSVGFGFRLAIDPAHNQGDYSGTLTFTYS